MGSYGEGEGVRAVSFDGGVTGNSGLAQLYAFKEVLDRVAFDKEEDESTLKPSRYVDLFAGTELGGIYAILFSRLELTVGQVIEFQQELDFRLFASPQWANMDKAGCSELLDELLNDVLGDLPIDDKLDVKNSSKGFICVVNTSSPATPRFLRTYQVRENFGPRCTIRQALHTALADNVHLPPVLIQDGHISSNFVSAHAGFNNPTAVLVTELRLCFPKAEHVACILNLGISLSSTLSESGRMEGVAEGCRHVGEVMAAQCQDLGPFFFRLSVDVSEQNLDHSERIVAATKTFLLRNEVSSHINQLVSSLISRPHVVAPLRLCSLAGKDGNSRLQTTVNHINSTFSIAQLKDLLRPIVAIPNIGQEHFPCLSQTRVDILNVIRAWVRDRSAPNICVLRGHPGTGKSTIATSLAHSLAAEKLLGAQFFCRREEAASHTPRVLWRLIACQLVQKQSSFATTLSSQCESDKPDVESLSVKQLFESVIARPLETASFDEPIVVIIDALDEFGGLDLHSDSRRELLKSLTYWQHLPSYCRLFLTTRWQGDISTALEVDPGSILTLEVGKDTTIQSSEDIHRYYAYHFSDIAKTYTSLPTPWPSIADLDLLTESAAGLFIWASTVVKLVAQNPSMLDLILARIRSGTSAISGTTGVNGLYNVILESAFPRSLAHEIFADVTGAVIVARFPLSRSALSQLLSLSELEVERVCKALQPVLGSVGALTFTHQSFVDFLLDESCPERFRCKLSICNGKMSEACLGIMRSPQLHFNMARMKSSYSRHREVHRKRVPDHIRYACRFWVTHLNQALILFSNLGDVRMVLRFILERKLLFWLEVICLDGIVGDTVRDLDDLLQQNSAHLLSVSSLIGDSISFIRTLVAPISKSYPHIYLSALPFTPPSSLVSQNYRSFFRNSLFVSGLLDHWPQSRVFPRRNPAYAIAFSPDNRQILAGLENGTIIVLDLDTGLQICSPVRAHDFGISFLAVSADGCRIASGGDSLSVWEREPDGSVGQRVFQIPWESCAAALSPDGRRLVVGTDYSSAQLVDAITGQNIEEYFFKLEGNIWSLAFSSDGTWIALGSEDGTVCLWPVNGGSKKRVYMHGHIKTVMSVAFSPDGCLIVSGSTDRTVRIWDAITGHPIGTPLGHRDTVSSVTFSPDGYHVLSGSYDGSLCLWGVTLGSARGNLLFRDLGNIYDATFSPNGKWIVSSCYKALRLWNTDSLHKVVTAADLVGHDGVIRSIAVFPDSRQIVSASADTTLRLWDTASCKAMRAPLVGHKETVLSVAISPDCQRIISNSSDGIVRIWDAVTGFGIMEQHFLGSSSIAISHDNQWIAHGAKNGSLFILDAGLNVLKSFEGHTKEISSIAFSPDDEHIISGSSDGTVRIWNRPTGKAIWTTLIHGLLSNISSVQFSPDGNQIAAAAWNGTIYIWDIQTQSNTPAQYPHTFTTGTTETGANVVWSIDFSPNGQYIVGAYDDDIEVWDTQSGQLIAVLRGHMNRLSSVRFTPDGQKIVSSSFDRNLRVWNAPVSRQFVNFSSCDSRLVNRSHTNLRGTTLFVNDDFGAFYSIVIPETRMATDCQRAYPSCCRFHRHREWKAIPTGFSTSLPSSVFLREDSWVVGNDTRPLFFVPVEDRRWVQTVGCIAIGGKRPMMTFNFTNFRYGKSWIDIYTGRL